MRVITKRIEREADGTGLQTFNERAASMNACQANVAPIGYMSCGKKMRRLKSGDFYCSEHGVMH